MAPIALAALLGGAAGFGLNALTNKAGGKAAAQMATPAATDAQKVDASAPGANNLGRAALISTSSQGVMGMDPVGRYKLLGN